MFIYIFIGYCDEKNTCEKWAPLYLLRTAICGFLYFIGNWVNFGFSWRSQVLRLNNLRSRITGNEFTDFITNDADSNDEEGIHCWGMRLINNNVNLLYFNIFAFLECYLMGNNCDVTSESCKRSLYSSWQNYESTGH